jgi:hypothetical protein
LARNNVTVEKELGIPTVGFVSRSFQHDYWATARACGIVDLPQANVPREFTSSSVKDVQDQAEAAIDAVIKGITTPLAGGGRIQGPLTTPTPPPSCPIAPPASAAEIRFTAPQYDKAYDEFNQRFLDWGWGDGFPLVPPTKEKVDWMLTGTHQAREEVVAEIDPAKGRATVEKIAINAVMAGARPEYLPVILGAVEAIVDPTFSLMTCQVSTGPYTPFLWVNGPIIDEIGMNCGRGCLGPGAPSKANIAIGRALRLILMNIGGAYLGIGDMDTIGSPNKFSMVVAENEKESPWNPYHVDKGFKAEESTVTALAVVGQTEVQDLDSNTPEGFLYTYIQTICSVGNGGGIIWSPLATNPAEESYARSMGVTKYGHEPVLLLPPSAAKTIAEAGWTKDDIRAYLFERACIPKSVWLEYSKYKIDNGKNMAKKWKDAPPDAKIPIVLFPEAFQILVVGGPANKMSYCPTAGTASAVTRSVDRWR